MIGDLVVKKEQIKAICDSTSIVSGRKRCLTVKIRFITHGAHKPYPFLIDDLIVIPSLLRFVRKGARPRMRSS